MLKIQKPVHRIRIPVKDEQTGAPLFVFRAELHDLDDSFDIGPAKRWVWQTFPVPEELFEAETGLDGVLNPIGDETLTAKQARKHILMSIVEFLSSGAGRFHYFSATGAHPN